MNQGVADAGTLSASFQLKYDQLVSSVNDVRSLMGDMQKTVSLTTSLMVRENNSVEKSALSLARQIEAQADSFGMSAAAARAYQAEVKAGAAAAAGYDGAAAKIREAAQRLYDLEYAAMRSAKAEAEAAAEAKAAAQIEAEAVRAAAAAHALFEAKVRQGAAALREMEAAEKASAMQAQAEAVRSAAAAHQLFEARVRQGVTAMREQDVAAAKDAAALERLREMIDPAAAAQDRLNHELAEAARIMIAAGHGSADLARAQGLLTERSKGVVGSSGAMKSGMQQLSFQLNDVAVGFAAGTPPMVIFAQQGGQVIQAMQLMSGESKGLLGFLGGPWGMVLTSALVVLSPFVGKLFEGGEAAKAQEEALKEQAKAIADLDQITGAGNKTQAQRVAIGVAAAKAALEAAQATRQQTKAELERMLAIANAPVINAPRGEGANAGAALAQDIARSSAVSLQKLLDQTNASIVKNERSLRASDIPGMMAKITAMTDKNSAATQRLTDAQTLLKQAYSRGDIGQAEFIRRGLDLQHQLDAVANSGKLAAAAQREHNKDVRDGVRAEKEYEKSLLGRIQSGTFLGQFTSAMDKNPIVNDNDIFKGLPTDLSAQMKEIEDARAGIERLAEAEKQFNLDQLHEQLELTAHLSDSLGESLSAAFGKGGAALGSMVKILGDYGKRQQAIDEQTQDAAVRKKLHDDEQLTSMLDLTGAAKGLFKEHSTGYKAMAAAEKALTIVQVARTAVAVAEGAANMFASAGPLGFPLVAAMLGVMASLGFSGGGSSATARSTNEGKGTVFGASSAKSDSIKRSLDFLGDLDGQMLVYSREMAASLKNIESQIGGVTNLVLRNGLDDVSGKMNVQTGYDATIGKNLSNLILGGVPGLIVGPLLAKIPVIGDILGIAQKLLGGLFGTKTKVVGSGIYGAPQSLGDIDSMGFDGQTFADIQKKKKVFGLTSSTKYSTQYGALDDTISAQFGQLLLSFGDTIKLAAGPLGVDLDSISTRLDGFVVDIGKIDLDGLSGDEIQKKLEAVFGAQADKMAQYAVSGLDKFQKVGEGYFETLVRVAGTVDTVTTSLTQLGLASASLGIDASMSIAGFFDSASSYASAANSYFETYYSDAEQAAAKTAQLGNVFTALGITMPDTIASFRSLVEAQDLTTAAGQQTYASLIQLAPAFAEIASGARNAASAAGILRERNDLERQLLELNGDTAKLRELDLAAVDPTNRAVLEQIQAKQDQIAAEQAAQAASQAAQQAAQQAAAEAQRQAEEAVRAAEQLRNAWTSIADSIMDEVKRIRGESATGGQNFAQLQGSFNAASIAARLGDQDAAKSLPGLSKSLLDVAAGVATSRQELARVQALTAASLEQTYRTISAVTGSAGTAGASSAVEAQAWWQSYASMSASTAGTPANDALIEEVKALRQEIAGMRGDSADIAEQMIAPLKEVEQVLRKAQQAGGGTALAVEVAA